MLYLIHELFSELTYQYLCPDKSRSPVSSWVNSFLSLSLQVLCCSISEFIIWSWSLLSETRPHKYQQIFFYYLFIFACLGTTWQCFRPWPIPDYSWQSLLLWSIINNNSLWRQSFNWPIWTFFYLSITPSSLKSAWFITNILHIYI